MRKPAPDKLLEKHVVRQCNDYFRSRGWRPVRTGVVAGPGFSSGEPGMPDYCLLRYLPNGVGLILWCEYKGPNDKRKCTCRAGEAKECKFCRQKKWHERERARGAEVWVVSDIMDMIERYEKRYAWLHTGETGRGQLDLLAGAEATA